MIGRRVACISSRIAHRIFTKTHRPCGTISALLVQLATASSKRCSAHGRRATGELSETQTCAQVLHAVEERLSRSRRVDKGFAVQCWHRLGSLRDANVASLGHSATFSELVKALCAFVSRGSLDTRDLTKILVASSYLRTVPGSEKLINMTIREIISMLSFADPDDLAGSASAMAKAKILNTAFIGAIASEAMTRIAEFSPFALSSLAHAFSILSVTSGGLVDHILSETFAKRRQFSPQSMGRLMHAFAKLRISSDELYRLGAEDLSSRLRMYSTLDKTKVAWSLAKASTQDATLFRVLAHDLVTDPKNLPPHCLAQLTWAFATARESDVTFFQMAAQQSAAQVKDFKLHEISNLLWAFGTTGIINHDMFDVLSPAIRSFDISRWTPQRISNIAWSHAKLGVRSCAQLEHLATVATAHLPAFTTQNLANLAWSFATLVVQDTHLFDKIAEQTSMRVGDFNAQELSSMSWAFGKVRFVDTELFDGIATSLHHRKKTLTAQHLANIAWAFAAVGLVSDECFRVIEIEALDNTSNMKLNELSSLVWSFATVSLGPSALFCSVEGSLLEHVQVFDPDNFGESYLAESAACFIGAAWAFNLVGHLTDALSEKLRNTVNIIGRELDMRRPGPQSKRTSEGVSCTSFADASPKIAVELRDRLVVDKPADWEVNYEYNGKGRHQLSDYLQSLGSCPIWFDSDNDHCFGFLHRIDVPSSGLVTVAKKYQAFYDLKFQLNVGMLKRDYLVLCHGWVPPSCREVSARILWVKKSSLPSEIQSRGKPAKSQLKVLAHAQLASCSFSLVAIRVSSGRQHQIRIHTAHIGHPTVCDGKYAEWPVCVSDRDWCEQNFLHRYRLAFQDDVGVEREIFAPLPPHLIVSLSSLQPRDEDSADVLQELVDNPALRSWDDYIALGKSN